MVRTDVSYFQQPNDLPNVIFDHHDDYVAVEMDTGITLYLADSQLAHLYARFGEAIEQRKIMREKKARDNATL